MTTTRAVIDEYFRRLTDKADWSTCLADDMVFTSFTSPNKRVEGKAAYLEATRRFYSTIATTKVKDVLVDGAKACALTHYDLQAPGRPAFGTDVAEVFQVRAGKIASFDIYFDATPFPK
jgi:ketosteroid isomerase-like protein